MVMDGGGGSIRSTVRSEAVLIGAWRSHCLPKAPKPHYPFRVASGHRSWATDRPWNNGEIRLNSEEAWSSLAIPEFIPLPPPVEPLAPNFFSYTSNLSLQKQ
jgi:hypothetical protein